MVHKLVFEVGKPKSTSICPYLIHLYHNQEILTEQKLINYKATKELIKYRTTPNPEPQSKLDSQGVGLETKNLSQPEMIR